MSSERQSTTILVVDDDIKLCDLVSDYLSEAGFVVTTSHSGEEAVNRIRKDQPDLVVLDLMLPGMDGLSVCRTIRHEFRGSILMLTALDDTIDQITGLEVGADDYVTKPVSPRLLLARIRALLRRAHSPPDDVPETIAVESLTVDRANREVWLDGQELVFTTAEFDVLWILARHSGSIVSRDSLHEQMYNLSAGPDDRRIDLLVSRIRRKLDEDSTKPKYIKTVRGKGYLLGKGH